MTKAMKPVLIESDNLSRGWGEVLLRILEPGGGPISPLTLSITGFSDEGVAAEDPTIRSALDALLVKLDKRDVENVAFTIFPERYLQIADGDRKEFFELYRESFSRIKSFSPQHNARGSYFERLIDYHGDGKINQLEWMIEEYAAGGHRRTKFQASIFDPTRDPTSQPYMEFPCLQGISFTFEDAHSLTLNAFYATQQFINKGYGNYLGLSRLGAFMAKQLGGRRLTRINSFVGIAKADNEKKHERDLVLHDIRAAIKAGAIEETA